MSGERPPAAVPARALPEDAEPAGTRPAGPERPASEPPDSEPLDTGPPAPAAPGPAEARALIRTQLRIALGTCAAVMTVVIGLPVLLAAAPAVARARVHGVPLWWLVLALGVQPVWIVLSRCQLGRAERAERDLARPAGRP